MRTAGVLLGAMLAWLAGCKSSQPDLQPPKQPEAYTVPPFHPRYDQPWYPPEAFRERELFPRKDDNPILPAKGMGGAGTPGVPSSPGRPY